MEMDLTNTMVGITIQLTEDEMIQLYGELDTFSAIKLRPFGSSVLGSEHTICSQIYKCLKTYFTKEKEHDNNV